MISFLRAALVAAMMAGATSGQAFSSITVTSTVVPLTEPDLNTTLNLVKFDPALGILQQVGLTLHVDMLGRLFAENTGGGSSYYSAEIESFVSLKRPDLSEIVMAVGQFAAAFEVGSNDGVFDFAGPSGNDVTSMSTTHAAATLLGLADLTMFAGDGSLALPLSTATWAMTVSSGNGTHGTRVKVGAFAEVTYFYEAAAAVAGVPEPATWALLVGGFGLVGTAVRRRRSALAA